MVTKLTDKYDLSDKTALITGGAGLLGIEHAYALLQNNASVVITDISEELCWQKGANLKDTFCSEKISFETLDVSDERSVSECHKKLTGNDIRIDILINNAAMNPNYSNEGGLQNGTRLENFNIDVWNKEISVGLTGTFLCSKVFGSQMASDGKGGVILNIASDLSVIAPDQRLYSNDALPAHLAPVKPITYSVIKTGIVGLTRYLATYWATEGVRCNALSPGGVFADQDDEFVAKITERIPMGRMAEKSDYREAVQFLCSDASAYMNGQNIVIDGGRSIW